MTNLHGKTGRNNWLLSRKICFWFILFYPAWSSIYLFTRFSNKSCEKLQILPLQYVVTIITLLRKSKLLLVSFLANDVLTACSNISFSFWFKWCGNSVYTFLIWPRMSWHGSTGIFHNLVKHFWFLWTHYHIIVLVSSLHHRVSVLVHIP